MLKPVLMQGFQVFFVLLFHTADLSKTLTSALTIWEKKWNRCCAVIEFAKEKKKDKTQHLSHCLSYVSCPHFSGTSASVTNGMWISRPRYCQWVKRIPALCRIIVPHVCVFVPSSFVCFLFVSKQVVRLFNAFQRFNAHSPWLWRMLWHPHLSYLIFQHSECLLFDILLYFVIAAEKYHNLWTCILYMWYVVTILCSLQVNPQKNVFCTPENLTASCATNPPLGHPSTRCKAQSLLPFIEVSSWLLCFVFFFSITFHFTINRWSDHVSHILWCYYRVIEPNGLL